MSPKNKGNFGQGKPAIEPQDEFVSGVEKVANKLRPRARAILVVAGGIFVLLAAWLAYQHVSERAQAQATRLYDEALDLSQRPVNPPAEEPAGKDGEPAAAEPAADADAEEFKSYDARAAAVLAKLEKLQAEHGSTATAKSARLLQARTLYDLGRHQDAAEMYRAILADPPMPDVEWVAREGLGYAQEAAALASEDGSARQAALQQALETFRQIQSKDDGPHRDYALYHEARILAMLDQKTEAIGALQKALEVAPESLLTNDIKQRLAQLEAPAKE